MNSSTYNYMRARQLEGTFPQDAGCWDVTAQRIMFGWGIPTSGEDETSAERDPLDPGDPPGIDELASLTRIDGYQRVRNASECARALELHMVVGASFEITPQWFS